MIGATQPAADDDANYGYVAAHRKSLGEPRPELLAPTVLPLYRTYLSQIDAIDGPVPHPFPPAHRTVLTENADYLHLRCFNATRSEILTAAPTGKCAYCY